MEAVAKEVIAWRGWRVECVDEQWFLHSINHFVKWEGPTLTADDIPSGGNSNGVYALASRDWVAAQGYCGNCVGEVALSGVVVEGSNGYRAERATIRSLTLIGYPAPDVRPIEVMAALEERYQCEVAWEEQHSEYPGLQQQQAALNAQLAALQMNSSYFSSAGTQLISPSAYGFGGVLSGLGGTLGKFP